MNETTIFFAHLFHSSLLKIMTVSSWPYKLLNYTWKKNIYNHYIATIKWLQITHWQKNKKKSFFRHWKHRKAWQNEFPFKKKICNRKLCENYMFHLWNHVINDMLIENINVSKYLLTENNLKTFYYYWLFDWL